MVSGTKNTDPNIWKSYFIEKGSKKKNAFATILASIVVGACKDDNGQITLSTQENNEESQSSSVNVILSENISFTGTNAINDEINTNYPIFKTIPKLLDADLSDKDNLIVVANEDILITPTVEGIEIIEFELAGDITDSDNTLNVDLTKISNFQEIIFSRDTTDPILKSLSVTGASKKLTFESGLNTVITTAQSDTDLSLEFNENSTVTVNGEAKDLYINGGGKSLNITSSNLNDIEISENNSVILNAPTASGNLLIISNGSVDVQNAGMLSGNADISAIGTISIGNLSSLNGKIELDNLRSAEGNDITVLNASSAKSVKIDSVGAVTAVTNNGLDNAETLFITAAEDSSIHANKIIPRTLNLNSVNSSNNPVTFNLDVKGINSLAFGGTSPIILSTNATYLDGAHVTSTNSTSAKIYLTGDSVDISNIAENIEIEFQNIDGKKINVGQNQNLVIDATYSQTSGQSVPEFQFTGTSSASARSISIKTSDSIPADADNLASFDGLSLSNIEVVSFNLANGINFQSTKNIVGDSLTQVNLTGNGNFNLAGSNIVSGLGKNVTLNAANYSGNLTVKLDNTANSINTVTGGTGNDTVTIDGISVFNLNSGDGNDQFFLTANSDGYNTNVTINGGNGVDTLTFASGVDFSIGSMALSNIENFEFTGGPNATKLVSNAVSTKNYHLSENGTGTINLSIFPTQQVINLSSLTFDNSFTPGTDKITVDGSNYSLALNITGSTFDDEIIGTHTAADTLNGGDGNDIIRGSDGNDTLTGGNGADQIYSGMGNDTVNLSEVYASTDTLVYSIDDGASNVDTVTGFDVRVANDVINLDVSELSSPITYGNGSNASAAGTGTITIYEQALDTDLNYASNASASIIKLITPGSDFAAALGSSTISVANNAAINFLWYDGRNSQVVFGYANENSAGDSNNEIKAEDTFVEITRLAMTESNYTHYLDTNHFTFI